MAYRRRQGVTRSSTFKEDFRRSSPDDVDEASVSSPTLAAKAIRASAAHRESSLSSAYSQSAYRDRSKYQGAPVYDYTSMKSVDEAGGFWGVLARKAKAILEDETMSQKWEDPSISTLNSNKHYQSFQHSESPIKLENPTLRKGLDALTSSLNHIGNALEEGRSIVENKTADIIQETRKLQIRRRGTMSSEQNQICGVHTPRKQTQAPLQLQTSNEDQLQASRNVAMATAAKAKLLLRELKTLKADLAFAKERCSQLEDENRTLREAGQKGDNPADDDMIRVQLETLLAEKARLANENAEYARENRFLREIVEYHQLTMQDVVYLDDDIEEVTEVYPYPAVSRILSASPPSPPSSPPHSHHETSPSRSSSFTKEMLPVAVLPKETKDISQIEVPVSSNDKGPVVQQDSTDPY